MLYKVTGAGHSVCVCVYVCVCVKLYVCVGGCGVWGAGGVRVQWCVG